MGKIAALDLLKLFVNNIHFINLEDQKNITIQ